MGGLSRAVLTFEAEPTPVPTPGMNRTRETSNSSAPPSPWVSAWVCVESRVRVLGGPAKTAPGGLKPANNELIFVDYLQSTKF
jgi:hypothetical protein